MISNFRVFRIYLNYRTTYMSPRIVHELVYCFGDLIESEKNYLNRHNYKLEFLNIARHSKDLSTYYTDKKELRRWYK